MCSFCVKCGRKSSDMDEIKKDFEKKRKDVQDDRRHWIDSFNQDFSKIKRPEFKEFIMKEVLGK